MKQVNLPNFNFCAMVEVCLLDEVQGACESLHWFDGRRAKEGYRAGAL